MLHDAWLVNIATFGNIKSIGVTEAPAGVVAGAVNEKHRCLVLRAVPAWGQVQQNIARMRLVCAEGLLDNTVILATFDMKRLGDKIRGVVFEKFDSLPGGAVAAGNIADNANCSPGKRRQQNQQNEKA